MSEMCISSLGQARTLSESNLILGFLISPLGILICPWNGSRGVASSRNKFNLWSQNLSIKIHSTSISQCPCKSGESRLVHSRFQHDIEKETQNRFVRNEYGLDFTIIIIFYAKHCHKADFLLYIFPKIVVSRNGSHQGKNIISTLQIRNSIC